MQVRVGKKEILCYCDVCGEICEDGVPDFVIAMNYGSEDSCFGSGGEEYELMEKLGDHQAVWSYLAQPEYFMCDECRHYGDHKDFLSKFETTARLKRVKLLAKLAKKKLIPEFAEDKEVKAERFNHWRKECDRIRAELREATKSDWGVDSLAKELVSALQKIQEYSA